MYILLLINKYTLCCSSCGIKPIFNRISITHNPIQYFVVSVDWFLFAVEKRNKRTVVLFFRHFILHPFDFKNISCKF